MAAGDHIYRGALAGLLLLAAGCVRPDVGDATESVAQASRVTAEDAVVLCPLAATADELGGAVVAWAGYPPGDDRLQLMFARVSLAGRTTLEPRGILLLDDELMSLTVTGNPDQGASPSFWISSRQVDGSPVPTLLVDADGHILDARENLGNVDSLSDTCDVVVRGAGAGDRAIRLFLGQEDGDLPLYAEQVQPR